MGGSAGDLSNCHRPSSKRKRHPVREEQHIKTVQTLQSPNLLFSIPRVSNQEERSWNAWNL